MFPEIKTTLYHGTVSEIMSVDVNAGRSLRREKKYSGQADFASESGSGESWNSVLHRKAESCR